jgi:outer membrane lipoprotein SlyB
MASSFVPFVQNMFSGSGSLAGAAVGMTIGFFGQVVGRGNGFNVAAAATGASSSMGAIFGSVVGQTFTSALSGSTTATLTCATLSWLLRQFI